MQELQKKQYHLQQITQTRFLAINAIYCPIQTDIHDIVKLIKYLMFIREYKIYNCKK